MLVPQGSLTQKLDLSVSNPGFEKFSKTSSYQLAAAVILINLVVNYDKREEPVSADIQGLVQNTSIKNYKRISNYRK